MSTMGAYFAMDEMQNRSWPRCMINADELDDILVWHDWISDTVYEIMIAAKSKEDIVKVLQAKPSYASWCYERSGETIEHEDWRTL